MRVCRAEEPRFACVSWCVLGSAWSLLFVCRVFLSACFCFFFSRVCRFVASLFVLFVCGFLACPRRLRPFFLVLAFVCCCSVASRRVASRRAAPWLSGLLFFCNHELSVDRGRRRHSTLERWARPHFFPARRSAGRRSHHHPAIFPRRGNWPRQRAGSHGRRRASLPALPCSALLPCAASRCRSATQLCSALRGLRSERVGRRDGGGTSASHTDVKGVGLD